MQTLVCDDDTRALLLAKETEITDLQLSNNQRYRQIRELQAEIRYESRIHVLIFVKDMIVLKTD